MKYYMNTAICPRWIACYAFVILLLTVCASMMIGCSSSITDDVTAQGAQSESGENLDVSRSEVYLGAIIVEAVNNYTIKHDDFRGATLLQVRYEGQDVLKEFDPQTGTVTLDPKYLPEFSQEEIVGTVIVDTTEASYFLDVQIVTIEINSADELNLLPELINQYSGAGYYILGNDIVCVIPYPIGPYTKGFSGVFDGRGCVIYNLQTTAGNNCQRGFLGYLTTEESILKNVSFINAKHSGKGGFITTFANGTIENVYIRIDITPNEDTKKSAYATSALTSDPSGAMRLRNVLVEYEKSLPRGSVTGYAAYSMPFKYGCMNGFYVIGAESVYGIIPGVGKSTEPDIYGAFMTREEMREAGLDFSSWDNTFWDIVDGIPFPAMG